MLLFEFSHRPSLQPTWVGGGLRIRWPTSACLVQIHCNRCKTILQQQTFTHSVPLPQFSLCPILLIITPLFIFSPPLSFQWSLYLFIPLAQAVSWAINLYCSNRAFGPARAAAPLTVRSQRPVCSYRYEAMDKDREWLFEKAPRDAR